MTTGCLNGTFAEKDCMDMESIVAKDKKKEEKIKWEKSERKA